MLLGTHTAIIVSIVGVVVQSSFPWRRKVTYRILFNLGMIALTVFLAGVGYGLIVRSSSPGINDQLAGILIASFVYYLCNSILMSLVLALTSGASIWILWHDNFFYTAPTFLLTGMVSLAAVRLALVIRFGVIAATVPMLALTYYSVRVYLEKLANEKKHAAEMAKLNESLERRVEERSESLRIAKENAEAANRAKTTFLANMSHELRTPLNAIIGYSEMLQEVVVDSDNKEILQDLVKIQTAGKHLLSLINDILDISKIEAGRIEADIEAFDLADILEGVVTTIKPLALKNRNVVQIMPFKSIAMMSDQRKICQVLINILSNACKFTQAGTVSVSVGQENRGSVPFVDVVITDTGIGMDSVVLGRLFEPFVQGDSSTTRRFGGTGLGLAISRKLCRLIGGDVTVTSVPGKGSTFTVTLPVDARLIVGSTKTTDSNKMAHSPALPITTDEEMAESAVRV